MKIMRAAAMLCSLVLAACGGGGGGDGGGPSQPQYSVSVSPSSVTFEAVLRQPLPAAQTLTATFRGDGLVVGYAPGVAQPSWLSVSVVGSPTSSPAQIRFAIPPNITFTQTATLTTTVRFVSGRADGSQVVTQDVPVTLNVRDPFAASVASVDLDATVGTASSQRSFLVYGSGSAWTATANQPWIQLTPTSGSGSGTQINVTGNASSLGVGTQDGNIRLQDSSSGNIVNVPVRFFVSADRWNASRIGAQLLEFSDAGTAAQAVRITSDSGAALSWTASADVPWLSVTPGGNSGGTLTIDTNAGASALAQNTSHFGTVTISGAGLQTETVRVGYFRSSLPSPATNVVAVSGLGGASRPIAMATDPVRPIAYVAYGTASVYRVNFITGTVDELANSSSANYVAPTVSGDGRFLYVMNTAGPSTQVFNLDTGQSQAVWPRTNTSCCLGVGRALSWTRLRGVGVLLNNYLEVMNLTTGVLSPGYAPTPTGNNDVYSSMQPTPDGRFVYTFGEGLSSCQFVNRHAVITRPSTGDGFLGWASSFDPRSPSDNGCVEVRDIAPTDDDASRTFIGFRGNGYSRLFEQVGNVTTEIDAMFDYDFIRLGTGGLRIAAFREHPVMRVRVIAPNHTLGVQLGDFSRIDDIAFVSDERFVLALGSGTSTNTGVHLFRLP